LDPHPESPTLGLDALPSSQGSSLSSVSLETLANDVQFEEETHLQSFTDRLKASMQDFLAAIRAKTQHKYNKLHPAAQTVCEHKQQNHEHTKKLHAAGYQDICSFFWMQPRTGLASEAGIHGHLKKWPAAQVPSKGSNKGVGASFQGHGHCEMWPSEGGNEGAGASSQGDGHCEMWPSEGGKLKLPAMRVQVRVHREMATAKCGCLKAAMRVQG